MLCVIAISLTLVSCNVVHKPQERETIFDRVVTIPSELITDIPTLSPLCDELRSIKKGFVNVENGKLYYEEEGEGIPLILLNPGPGGLHHCFHPHFSRIKDIARVIYYDARGTGKSSIIDDIGKNYPIKQAIEDIESLRKALGIKKWTVLGWSFGGFLAQCYVLTYTEHVAGLILVAAQGDFTKAEMTHSRKNMFISESEKKAISEILRAKKEGKLNLVQALYNANLCGVWKKQGYYKPTSEEFIRHALYEWSPAPGFNELMCIDAQKISFDGKFDDFGIPTLLMEAKWDLTWNTDKVGFMRKTHPHAQFEYFEYSGHQIYADEPEKFFNILRDFLKKYKNIN